MQTKLVTLSILALFGAALLPAPARAVIAEDGFETRKLADDFVDLVGLGVLEDGHVLLAEKAGSLILVDGDTETTIGVVPANEILAMAVAPDVTVDGGIYLYRRTHDPVFQIPVGQVIRVPFDAASGTADVDALAVLLDGIADGHPGGALEFGPDGKLYVAISDIPLTPRNENLNELEGKVHRSVPGSLGWEMVAYGFQRPRRMGFDPVSGALWLGQQGMFEQEIFRVVEGANHTGVAPVLSYDSSTPPYFGEIVRGGSVPGGGAFAAYSDHYFFGDRAAGSIWAVPLDAARDGFAGDPVLVARDINGPQDMEFGPDGALYFIGRNKLHRVAPESSAPPPPPPGTCTDVDECMNTLQGSLPDPATASCRKERKAWAKLGKLYGKAVKAQGKAGAAAAIGKTKKHRKQLAKQKKLITKIHVKVEAPKYDGIPTATVQTIRTVSAAICDLLDQDLKK